MFNIHKARRAVAIAAAAGAATLGATAISATPAAAASYPTAVSSHGWVQPMDPKYARITDVYGSRGHNHFGTDYAVSPNRSVPIRAAKAGTVKRVASTSRSGGYGNMVDIYHKGVGTRYAHMSRYIVKPLQKVKAGQIIGYQGSTGQSTGPHLHFEVHKVNWASGWWGHRTTVDPQRFMRQMGAPLY